MDNEKPIMVGELVETINGHMKNDVPIEVLEAWSHLLPVLASVANLCKDAEKILVCAWCKQVCSTHEHMQEHIIDCEVRPKCVRGEINKVELLEDMDGAPFPEIVQQAFRTRMVGMIEGDKS